jgi:cyclin-dependent kinase regulatory subunit CKS1
MLKAIPKDYFSDPSKNLLKLLWEEEWRGLGITQVRTIVETKDWDLY